MKILNDDKKKKGISSLPVGFSNIMAKIILALTFLVAIIVYFGCEIYRAQYYPGASRSDFFSTEVLTVGISSVCFFLTIYVVSLAIVRLFLVLMGRIERMSPGDWFFLFDFLMMALLIPIVLKVLKDYRLYHPAPANEIFVEEYFAVIFTLCLLSFGGAVLFAYVGQRMDGSIK